jgi:hypothetical protein
VTLFKRDMGWSFWKNLYLLMGSVFISTDLRDN